MRLKVYIAAFRPDCSKLNVIYHYSFYNYKTWQYVHSRKQFKQIVLLLNFLQNKWSKIFCLYLRLLGL
jgi:hypothetical protein